MQCRIVLWHSTTSTVLNLGGCPLVRISENSQNCGVPCPSVLTLDISLSQRHLECDRSGILSQFLSRPAWASSSLLDCFLAATHANYVSELGTKHRLLRRRHCAYVFAASDARKQRLTGLRRLGRPPRVPHPQGQGRRRRHRLRDYVWKPIVQIETKNAEPTRSTLPPGLRQLDAARSAGPNRNPLKLRRILGLRFPHPDGFSRRQGIDRGPAGSKGSGIKGVRTRCCGASAGHVGLRYEVPLSARHLED